MSVELAPAIQSAIEVLRLQLSQVRTAQTEPTDVAIPELVEVFRNPFYWESLTLKQKQAVFRQLVVQVLIAGGKITLIQFRF